MSNKKRKSYLLSGFLIIFLALFSIQATYSQDRDISGTITEDVTNLSLPGVSVSVKGSNIGTITNAEGKYTLAGVPNNAIMVFRYVGMLSQEIPLGAQTVINVVMAPDLMGLEQVIVVGYGTKKKVNLTGSVSVVDKELLERRPVSNIQQALQGLIPNLIISANDAGGEPASNMSMNIRGLTSFEGGSSPYVLVDGIPMGINDVNPSDVESITVLKDAASTSIYGARAAFGVILITTKRGQPGSKVTYSMNYGGSSPTIWPDKVQTIDFAHALNEAKINAGGSAYYPEEALERFRQNLANPGSAAAMLAKPDGLNWDIMNTGTKAVANDDWNNLVIRQWAPRIKHNLSASGGTEVINYYISGGFYDEQGLLKFGNESYKRYNVDAKISAKVNSWMDVSLLTKYKNGHEDFPWNQNYGRAWIINWIGKLKPGIPAKYPGTDIWTQQTKVEEWKNVRENIYTNQLVASPRIRLEPVKGWVTNIELNYTSYQSENIRTVKQYPWVRPNGEIAYNPQSRASTQYRSTINTNKYISPNLYSTYTKSFGEHNLHVLGGYQQEVYEYNNLNASAFYLLSDAIPSMSTAVGEKTITDSKGHWATQSAFARLDYNFSEKYLVEFNVRADGSSRFDADERWGVFPSVSAGWVISKEDFFPLQDQFDLLKFRASVGTVGNQNVPNYLYIPTLPVSETGQWLFGGERAWTVGTPNLTSVELTWEQRSTIDLGLDAMMFDNRLGLTIGVYKEQTTNLVGPGAPLPAVLGTAVPKKNGGEVAIHGWEFEGSWKNRVTPDFSYHIRGVLSNYRQTVVDYNNPTMLIDSRNQGNMYYNGQIIGEIWGFETDGYYQTQEEIDNHEVDQTYIYSGNWNTGDYKYVDQNGDGVIDIGDNTVGDHGDLVLLGDMTPKFRYGFNAGFQFKGFDFSFLLQGVGKRDLDIRSSVFRGPAAGPMHNNVLVGHIDYWRDETSVLGANPDAYFPRPYAQYMGQNFKNFGWTTDHFLQNGAYLRVKNVRVGYTLPSSLTDKIFVSSATFYLSGENLLTFTKLMFFDPEAFGGRWYGGGDAYPLSRTLSIGLNINF